jgi:hypothetical protein
VSEAARAAEGTAAPAVADLVFPPVVSSSLVLIAMALSVFKPWGKIRHSGASRPTES